MLREFVKSEFLALKWIMHYIRLTMVFLLILVHVFFILPSLLLQFLLRVARVIVNSNAENSGEILRKSFGIIYILYLVVILLVIEMII